ncbi:MAG: LysE family translocator [Phenylobacterium sp.]|uniref:LysE family translocator n=1 Tax=Phenylobacterium sp. TaxID=1871053 RepID=UPI00391BBB1F
MTTPPTSFTPDLLAALTLFAFVSSITPGPNNTMLMASGANFGLRRTVPHLMGVSLGFLVLILAVGFGLGGLFAAYPVLHDLLKVAGCAYLLWLAWKLATAKGLSAASAGARPMTFLQAAGFQWVNPKAWAMAVSGVAAYTPQSGYVANLVLMGLVFTAVNLPCVGLWTGFGVGLRRFLDRPGTLRAFNLLMAALLVLSLWPMLAHA